MDVGCYDEGLRDPGFLGLLSQSSCTLPGTTTTQNSTAAFSFMELYGSYAFARLAPTAPPAPAPKLRPEPATGFAEDLLKRRSKTSQPYSGKVGVERYSSDNITRPTDSHISLCQCPVFGLNRGREYEA